MTDMLNKLMPSQTFESIKVDWIKVGLAFVVSRLLTGESLTDKSWAMSSLLVLLGFTAYNLLTARVVDSAKLASGQTKAALDDVLKVGTMLVVSRLLAGKPLNDQLWMRESAFVLAGFVAFDLVTHRLSDTVSSHLSLDNNKSTAVADTVKFSTMYAISRYLSGQEFNREWALESGGFIAGLVAYDLFLMQ